MQRYYNPYSSRSLERQANSLLLPLSSGKDRKKLRNRKPRKPRSISYKRYIKSSLWTDRKNKYYQEHSKQCLRCGSYEHVDLHHAIYDRPSFGNEPDNHLYPLCSDCHELFHKTHKLKKDMLQETIKFINYEA